MRSKRYLAVILSAILLLSGCGINKNKGVEAVNQAVVDSEGNKIQVWKVSARDIIKTKVYEGRVAPYAEKVSFPEEGQFGEYAVKIGDRVTAGQKLANSLEEEEIAEDMQEEISRLQENYQYQSKTLSNQLKIGQIKLEAIYDELDGATDGTPEYSQICVRAGTQDQANKRMELQISQLNEKYQLEKSWKEQQLQQTRRQSGENIITAPFNGIITNLLPANQGQELEWKSAYVALADTTRYQIVCEYIGQNNMNGLERAYAIIGGQEYELTHAPYEEDTYRAIRATQEKCYSFFDIQQPENVNFGDYAVVVAVQASAVNALAVPAMAIQRDSGGNYVYKMVNGEKVKTYIETGIFDGAYYEVIHGVTEGDEIFVALEGEILPNKGGNKIEVKGYYDYYRRSWQEEEEEPVEQAISEYLDLDALGAVRQGTITETEYKTQTLERSDFVVEWSKSASISTKQQKAVMADFDTGKMYFDAFTVSNYDYVEAGQCIANVMTEIDTITLAEKERKLKRLKERHSRDEVLYQEERQEKIDNRTANSPTEDKIVEVELVQEQLQWEKETADNRQQIQQLEEEIAELKKMAGITEIKAPFSGYIMSLETSLGQGQEMKNKDIVAYILPADAVLLQIDDANMEFGYGMTLGLQIGKEKKESSGTIVSMTGRSIRGGLADSVAMLQADCTAQELIKSKSYTVTGVSQNIKNVILVPANAVYRENENLYVIVKTKDGSYEKRGFTAGGNSKEWYWVLSGLEEGLEVVIK